MSQCPLCKLPDNFQRFLCIWVSALCGCTHVWCKFHEMCCADAWIWNILVSGTLQKRALANVELTPVGWGCMGICPLPPV